MNIPGQVAFAFAALSLTACGPFIERREAERGIGAAKPLVDAVESYKAEAGGYPESMEDVELTSREMKALEENGIRYTRRSINRQDHYILSFELFAS